MKVNYSDVVVSLYSLAELIKTLSHKAEYSTLDRAALRALSIEVINQLQEKIIGYDEGQQKAPDTEV